MRKRTVSVESQRINIEKGLKLILANIKKKVVMWENQLEHNRQRGEKRQLNIWIIHVTDFPKVETEQKRPEKMTYKITDNFPNMKKIDI